MKILRFCFQHGATLTDVSKPLLNLGLTIFLEGMGGGGRVGGGLATFGGLAALESLLSGFYKFLTSPFGDRKFMAVFNVNTGVTVNLNANIKFSSKICLIRPHSLRSSINLLLIRYTKI